MKNDQAVLLVVCMTSFITPFLASSVNVALPSINTDFSIPDQALLGWIVTGFLLSAAVFVVPFGRIADMRGRKKMFVSGLLIIVVSSFFCSISTTELMLIASRLIEGVGSAMIFGTGIAILTSAFPAKHRGNVLGINVAIVYVGSSSGPFLGGIITQYAGWRFIYAGIMVYALLAAILAQKMIKDDRHCQEDGRFDIIGTLLYAGSLFSLIFGLSIIPDAEGGYLLVLAALLMIVFLRWELAAENPVVNVGVFRRNPVFLFSNLAALINYSSTFAVAYLLSLYLQYLKGFDPQTTGLILVAQPIVQVVFSPFAGRLSDRMEPRIVASAGMGLCVIGLAVFSFLTPETSLGLVLASLMLLGLGFALFSSPNTNAIMSAVEPCYYGLASGMVSTMRLIGQMISLGIAMLTFSAIMGHVEIAPAQMDELMVSIKVAFGIFAGFCLMGMLFSLARGKMRSAGRNADDTVGESA